MRARHDRRRHAHLPTQFRQHQRITGTTMIRRQHDPMPRRNRGPQALSPHKPHLRNTPRFIQMMRHPQPQQPRPKSALTVRRKLIALITHQRFHAPRTNHSHPTRSSHFHRKTGVSPVPANGRLACFEATTTQYDINQFPAIKHPSRKQSTTNSPKPPFCLLFNLCASATLQLSV